MCESNELASLMSIRAPCTDEKRLGKGFPRRSSEFIAKSRGRGRGIVRKNSAYSPYFEMQYVWTQCYAISGCSAMKNLRCLYPSPIIFESLLTTCKASIIFEPVGAVS